MIVGSDFSVRTDHAVRVTWLCRPYPLAKGPVAIPFERMTMLLLRVSLLAATALVFLLTTLGAYAQQPSGAAVPDKGAMPAHGIAYPEGVVEIKGAFARATAGAVKNGAAYFTITSSLDDKIIAASSPIAEKVEIHEHRMDNGIMSMRPVASVPLAHGQAVTFEPGGFHVMLIGLKQKLIEGADFPLTVILEHGGMVETKVTVGSVGAKAAGGGGMHEGHSMGHDHDAAPSGEHKGH